MSHGDIPQQLRSIYLFCKGYLIRASVQRDPQAIDAVVALLSELRDAWDSVSRRALTSAA